MLITAFILIGLGVLVKRFPILIAGYNTMSKEEKMNVDVKGLSAFMCYSLVGMGTVPVLAYYICLGLGHADWASYCLFLPILYIPYLIVKANKFDHNPPKKSTKYVSLRGCMELPELLERLPECVWWILFLISLSGSMAFRSVGSAKVGLN